MPVQGGMKGAMGGNLMIEVRIDGLWGLLNSKYVIAITQIENEQADISGYGISHERICEAAVHWYTRTGCTQCDRVHNLPVIGWRLVWELNLTRPLGRRGRKQVYVKHCSCFKLFLHKIILFKKN